MESPPDGSGPFRSPLKGWVDENRFGRMAATPEHGLDPEGLDPEGFDVGGRSDDDNDDDDDDDDDDEELATLLGYNDEDDEDSEDGDEDGDGGGAADQAAPIPPQEGGPQPPPAALFHHHHHRQQQPVLSSSSSSLPSSGGAKRSLGADDELALRMRFLWVASSFAGTPYFRKGSKRAELYGNAAAKRAYAAKPDSRFRLDCCGLVRAAMWELYRTKEVPLKIKKWNQAYQRDSLPIVVSSWDQCQPGDLVFYRGRMKKGAPGKRGKRHALQHVEIMLGDGTRGTVGSRWGGVVAKHRDYRFESKRWTTDAYEFRSLRTWLEGTDGCAKMRKSVERTKTAASRSNKKSGARSGGNKKGAPSKGKGGTKARGSNKGPEIAGMGAQQKRRGSLSSAASAATSAPVT
jgi:cell wall-associated NlpC family hydrolase